MLRQISWQEFLLFLSIVLGLVYLYIGIKFGLPIYIAGRKGDRSQRMPGKIGANNSDVADTKRQDVQLWYSLKDRFLYRFRE
jgi:hypothetical protein